MIKAGMSLLHFNIWLALSLHNFIRVQSKVYGLELNMVDIVCSNNEAIKYTTKMPTLLDLSKWSLGTLVFNQRKRGLRKVKNTYDLRVSPCMIPLLDYLGRLRMKYEP